MGDFLPMPPPVLYGPIFPITPTLHLSGVGIGYALIAKGTTSGLLTNYYNNDANKRPIADQWIPFDTLPREGEYITVEQIYTFRAGGPYESGETPTDKRVLVQSLPEKFPSVAISPIHTCGDYIHLAGLIPGAWVNVQIDGGPMLVSEQAKKGTDDNFLLDPSVDLPGGKYIKVWQGVSKSGEQVERASDPMYSMIEKAQFSDPLSPLHFYETPMTCYNELAIAQILDGASISARAPNDDQKLEAITWGLERYKYEGWLPEVVGPGAPEIAIANQYFRRCGLKSPDQGSQRIGKTTKLLQPVLKAPICGQTTSLTLRNLATGNKLKIERFVNGQPSPQRDNVMWRDPIGGSELTIDMSPRWPFVDPEGPVSFRFQQFGGKGCPVDGDASEVTEVKITPTENPPQPELFPKTLYQCIDTLLAENLTPGAFLQIRDNDGQAILPRILPITDKAMFVKLPARLSIKKNVWIEQLGCGADLNSNPLEVIAYEREKLRSISLDSQFPPYGGDTGLRAVGLVPGAKVYVTVDGSRYTSGGQPWVQEFTAFSETFDIQLSAPLKVDAKVAVLQYLCDAQDLSEPKVYTVVQKRIRLFPQGTLVRGSTSSLKVQCQDNRGIGAADDSRWGAITIAEFGTIRCGGAVTVPVASNDARLSIPISIAATEFNAAGSTNEPIIPPKYKITFTASPRDQRVQHPTAGAVTARMESFTPSVTVNYPSAPNHLDLNAAPNQNSVSGTLQNPQARVDGKLQITAYAQLVLYGADGNALSNQGPVPQMLAIDVEKKWNDMGNLCINWNVAFQYGATETDVTWLAGEGGDLIHGQVTSC